jgi:hypothetical protein
VAIFDPTCRHKDNATLVLAQFLVTELQNKVGTDFFTARMTNLGNLVGVLVNVHDQN